MFAFALAVFFLFVTPGPGVLSLAGVGSAFGYRPAARYFAGLFVGTNMVALAVVSGLAAAVLALPHIRTVLFFASLAYLLYLALRIALSGTTIAITAARTAPGFWGGIVLQAVNPKAYAVNTAFFTGFAFMPSNLTAEMLVKFLIINAIWFPIHVGWLAAGVTVRRLDLPPRIQLSINVAMPLSILRVVALTALAPPGA
jgi:threonine/homoserine/homoserine lactone efflux protein